MFMRSDSWGKLGLTSAQIGIVVSLIASIMVNLHDSYPNYAWWSIAFMICITAGVIFIIGTNKIHLYGTAVRISPGSALEMKLIVVARWLLERLLCLHNSRCELVHLQQPKTC